MKNSTIRRMHLIYGIFLSVLIVAVGICFICSCISIYNSGANPFSRESVAAQFEKIAVPVYACIAAVVIGCMMTLVFPLEGRRERAVHAPQKTLAALLRRVELWELPPVQRVTVKRFHRGRLIRRIACTVGCIMCAIPAAVYLLTPKNFTLESLNHDVFSAIWLVGVCSAVAFGLCCVTRFWNDWSFRREIKCLKLLLQNGKLHPVDLPSKETALLWTRRDAVQTVVLALPAVLLCICLFSLIFADFAHGIDSAKLHLFRALTIVAFLILILGGILVCLLSSRATAKKSTSAKVCGAWYVNAVRITVLTIAVLFVVLGVLNGGMGDVLAKAIRICTECIGLG